MGEKLINIERDFSRYPAGRYVDDGPYSGERFRAEFLIPALTQSSDVVVIELDGARGLGSSFLEEAFGGLVRLGHPAQQLIERFQFKTEDASLIEEIKSYILEAKAGELK